ncbi:FK506-binding protein-like [Amphibalanus amphitrite]|uniref:FK506-binding protein-like n=1 Tax=Amphibalanus amphitrite TaxID=1232801 RepID=UPI001C902621|nr:FK506-binding protein-like [Amphibalanus amphitrite]
MSPIHWRSSDGAVERTLLPTEADRSAGGDGPPEPAGLCQPGARCRLLLETEPDCPPPAGLDLSDPSVTAWLPAGAATIGEADTELDRLLERCLRSLRPADRCRVVLRPRTDRLPAAARAAGEEAVLTLRLTVLEVEGGRPDARLSQSERLAVAEASRLRGNELFAAGRDVDALYRYRRALALLVYILPEGLSEAERAAVASARLACRANLSAVLLRRGRHEAARAAASRVLIEQPNHVRCLYRRGAANLALQDHEDAERDLRRVLELDPGNAAATRQMALLDKRKRDVDQHTANFMTKYFQQ